MVRQPRELACATPAPPPDQVLVNQGEAGCRCATSKPCACVPDAQITANGRAAQIFPSVTRITTDAAAARTGRVYRLRFTAVSAVTGLRCVGTTDVCVIQQPKPPVRGPPPTCAPFESSATVRDATACSKELVRVAATFEAGAAGALAAFAAAGVPDA